MNKLEQIIEQVAAIYQFVDSEAEKLTYSKNTSCKACGNCCRFELFDHKLYVTTPEIIYFRHFAQDSPNTTDANKQCPHQQNCKCSVRKFRFAGCRIFCCKADPDKQQTLSNETINKFQTLCEELNIEYKYIPFPDALNYSQEDTLQWIK